MNCGTLARVLAQKSTGSTENEKYRTDDVRLLARGTTILTHTEYEEYGVGVIYARM